MWICTRKHGPAPQESTLRLAKASLAAFPGVALQSAEVSQLWYLGVPGGCAQGPVYCRWRYACLGIACGSHVLLAETALASLPLLKRSFGLRCDADPFLGLWACMLFAFLHCVPCMWNQHPGTKHKKNMNGRCNLSQLNALFAEGKTHTPWAQNWDHTFGSWAANFSIVAPFLGPESGPCFGATKHKQELVNCGQQVCYCRRKLTGSTYPWYSEGTCPRR